MPWPVETALSNAAVATVLAVIAAAASRCLHRPAVTHALWVLVLAKLVTPPLAGLSIPISIAAPPEAADSRPVPTDGFHDAVSAPALAGAAVRDEMGRPANASPRTTAGRPERPARSAAARTHTPPRPASASAHRHAAAGGAVWWRSIPWPAVGSALLIVWGLGSLGIITSVAVRGRRFHRLVRAAGVSDHAVQSRADDLAAALGLRRSPSVLLVPWCCSPMLWGCGRAARVLFPTALWRRLDENARDALLLHELAHSRRGDQWVRLLELVASVLYWWHPIVWWARHAVAVSEEQCCDAWVVSRLSDPPRTYADALLTTLDFLGEGGLALPPAASGIGELPVLQQRLMQIMRRSVRGSLSRAGRSGVAALSLGALPLCPVLTLSPSDSAHAAPTATRLMWSPWPESSRLSPVSGSEPGNASAADGDPPAAAASLRLSVSPSPHPEPDGWWNAQPPDRWAITASPQGRYRLLAEVGHRVRLEDRKTGVEHDLAHARLTAAAFLPDGRRFVAGSLDGSVRVWDAETGGPASLLGWHEAEVRTLAVSPDGRSVASGGADGGVIVWEAASGAILHTWTSGDGAVASLRFSPDGRQLGIARNHGWEAESGRITVLETSRWNRQQIFTTSSPVAVLEFAADGSLYWADWSGRLSLWNPLTADSQPAGIVEKNRVSAASFSPDNRIVYQHQ